MDKIDYDNTVSYLKTVYPFAEREWHYTRNLGPLRRIVNDYDSDKLGYRLKSTFRSFFFGYPWMRNLQKEKSIRDFILSKYFTLVVGLRKDRHLPDGRMENASVITHWEEEGEYIQLVSPVVGDILVEWLENNPDDPYAQRIVTQMKLIMDSYFKRADDGWPDYA